MVQEVSKMCYTMFGSTRNDIISFEIEKFKINPAGIIYLFEVNYGNNIVLMFPLLTLKK